MGNCLVLKSKMFLRNRTKTVVQVGIVVFYQKKKKSGYCGHEFDEHQHHITLKVVNHWFIVLCC